MADDVALNKAAIIERCLPRLGHPTGSRRAFELLRQAGSLDAEAV